MSQITPPTASEQLSNTSNSKETAIEKNPSVAVILPTYCEAGNIENLIREIKNLIADSLVLVIDDSSHDGTATIVEELQKEYDNILCINRPSKLGLGTAITDGFRTILSLRRPPSHIVTMDADYSHNPNDLLELIAMAQKGYDLVIGSRYIKNGEIVGWHALRRLISRVANILASTMVAMKIHDCTSGYRCYSKKYIQNVLDHLHSQTYEIQIETVKQAWTRQFKVKEVPITFKSRKKGKSKLTKKEFYGFLSYFLRNKMSIAKNHN